MEANWLQKRQIPLLLPKAKLLDRYKKEFVGVLQTSELWSQLANTIGTEAGENRYFAPTLR